MNFLEVKPKTVQLTGLSRCGELTLSNKNELLSVSYFLTISNDQAHELSVFPEKGILLRGQSQKIKIKYSNQQTQCSLSDYKATLRLHHTFKTEYNKNFMQKNQIKGWSRIPQEQAIIQIDVLFGTQAEAIQKYIKSQVKLNKAFQSDQADISVIQQKQKSILIDQSFYDLGIQSRNGSQKQMNRSKQQIKQIKDKRISLDMDALKFGESRSSSFNGPIKQTSSYKMRYEEVESRLINSNIDKSFEMSIHTPRNSFFDNQHHSQNLSTQNRSCELIILAIIAAFCVALGNNIGRLLK